MAPEPEPEPLREQQKNLQQVPMVVCKARWAASLCVKITL